MPSRRLRPCLLLLAVAFAAPQLAAQADDARWLRQCQANDDRDDGRERLCEVRHTGFKFNGTTLTLDPGRNGGVDIVGWDRDSVAVTARIQTGARTEADARDLARGVRVEAGGSAVRAGGPSTGRREYWSASLLVKVPRRVGLQVETVNGPISVERVTGVIELRALNGPVSLVHVGGDVRARVQNGPLTVELDGTAWDGKGLDAESVNGPVTLSIPENYNAELETGTVNGPMVTSIPLTITVRGRLRDRIQTTLGRGGPPVRVVTTNGPITIRGSRGES